MINTNIPLYGLFILLSLFCGLINVYYLVKKRKYSKIEILILLLYIIVGATVGGKYFSFFTNMDKYNYSFSLYKVGLSSYGAVIGIILMIIIFCIQLKKDFEQLFSIVIQSVPLMYAIGKMGCFLSGCCYGIKYNGLFSIVYNYSNSAPNNVNLFPIQIVETIVFIVIFIYIKIISNKNKYIIEQVFILSGLSKFILDFFRNSHVGILLSINQIVSLIFVIIGLIIFIVKRVMNNKKMI